MHRCFFGNRLLTPINRRLIDQAGVPDEASARPRFPQWQIPCLSILSSPLLALIASCLYLFSYTPAEAEPSKKPLAQKRILWIDSYHQGYPWSDGTENGLRATLAGTGVKIDVFRMNAKNKGDPASLQASGLAALKQIEKTQPDLIVASDDPAQVYIVLPHLLGKSIPIVFTGVNRSAEPYGYPRPGMTGMVEVSQVETLFRHLATLSKGKRFAVLGADDLSERRSMESFRSQLGYTGNKTSFVLVNSYEALQNEYLKLQKTHDAIILNNITTLPGWEKNKARDWIFENTRVPTGTVNEWMHELALVTVGKIAEEQGEFAGQATLSILRGARPESIPVTRNQKSRLFLNKNLARQAGIVFPISMLRASSSPPKP